MRECISARFFSRSVGGIEDMASYSEIGDMGVVAEQFWRPK